MQHGDYDKFTCPGSHSARVTVEASTTQHQLRAHGVLPTHRTELCESLDVLALGFWKSCRLFSPPALRQLEVLLSEVCQGGRGGAICLCRLRQTLPKIPHTWMCMNGWVLEPRSAATCAFLAPETGASCAFEDWQLPCVPPNMLQTNGPCRSVATLDSPSLPASLSSC